MFNRALDLYPNFEEAKLKLDLTDSKLFQKYTSNASQEYESGNHDQTLFWYRKALKIDRYSIPLIHKMLSHGQEEFKKQNFNNAQWWSGEFDRIDFKNALFWYNSFLEYAYSYYTQGLAYNLIYCLTDDPSARKMSLRLLRQVDIEDPKYKNAKEIFDSLSTGYPVCSEYEI